jgi:hypothetical protein
MRFLPDRATPTTIIHLSLEKMLRLVNMVVDAAAIDRRKPRIVFDAVRRK